jgi:hypothetical protein
MTPDYLRIAALLKEEASRSAATARYLIAAAKVQAETARYIEKQFGRGDFDLCKGAIEGAVALLQDPARTISESGVRG